MGPRFDLILNASHDFITLVDREFTYDFVNDSYCQQMGISRDEILGKTIPEVWGDERFQTKIRRHLEEAFLGQESHDIDRFRFGQGFRYIHVSYYPYRDGEQITHVMIYSHDITAIKDLESKILDYEFKDSTTGLFNRKSFDIVLDMELEKAKRSHDDHIRAILFVNLRNFSQINARYGAETGDLLLESTALRIKEALRSTDYVFRFEGKQLAVLLTTMKRDTDIMLVAQNIREKTTFPYPFKDDIIHIDCHIGAAVAPADGETRQALMTSVLDALNEASEKDLPVVVFNRDLQARSERKARLRSDIRRALVEEQFTVNFQPIVYPDGRMAGAEALIRWKHKDLGMVSPAEFIPLAEETGDTVMIGRWNLFKICRLLKKWSPILKGRYVSVNLSAREFSSPGLVEYVEEVLQSAGTDPRSLKIEITETQSVADLEDAVVKIRRLEALGLEVYIDDFGSGYSSLAYLKTLPAKTIKIDKIFVDRVAEDPEERNFLQGMVAMIRSRGKNILVEGVETLDQVEILRDIGIDKIQGYYFSKPVTEEIFESFLREDRPLPVRS